MTVRDPLARSPRPTKKPFWVSWWVDPKIGFEIPTAWWVTGYRAVDGNLEGEMQACVCAAIMAYNATDAKHEIAGFHDDPVQLEFRFCTEKEAG